MVFLIGACEVNSHSAFGGTAPVLFSFGACQENATEVSLAYIVRFD